jgi:glycosyltransferase involved in cell wall biosynthesis
MKDPLVSVIIPSYNREKLIMKAIGSVMRQTFNDFEILVIDDASTDDTGEVIKNLNNEKIRYFRMERNGGQCIARNFGIRNARGRYIAFLDSDDEWLPEKLKLQVECFRKGPKELGAVYGYAYQTDVIKNETTLPDNKFYRGDIHDKFLRGFCPSTPSIFMITSEALKKVNGFDEKLITFVDLDLWLRISEHYQFDFIDEPVIIKYEQIGDQYINNFEKRYNGYKLFFKKWDEIVKNSAGRKALKTLKYYLALALVVPILEHPPKNLRKNIFKVIGLLLKVRSTRYNLYVKALSILLFGPDVVPFVRKYIKKETS